MSGYGVLVAAHALAAATGLLLGGYQLLRPTKGDARHRLLGWVWVATMTWVATSSFAIRELRHGQLSLLHVLSVVTLVSLVVGVTAARRGNIAAHRGAMRGSWLGVVGAFVGAVVVPDRRIPTFAVDDPLGFAGVVVAVVVLTAALVGAAMLLDPQRSSTSARWSETSG